MAETAIPHYLPLSSKACSVDCEECARPPHEADDALVVQSFRPLSQLPPAAGWTRLGKPPNQVPLFTGLSYWICRPLLQEGTDNLRYDTKAVAQVILRFLVAWPAALATAPSAIIAREEIEHANYHRVGWGQGKSTRNEASDAEETTDSWPNPNLSDNITVSTDYGHPSTGVYLRPSYLCFIRDETSDGEVPAYETRNVSEYIEENGENADTEFVFVSYTRMQFNVGNESEIDAYPYPDEGTREINRHIAHQDREQLGRWGVEAARAAGKKAFWLDFECIRDRDGVARSTNGSISTYRICDIVRAAHSMIVAVGPLVSLRVTALTDTTIGQESSVPSPYLHYSADSETRWLREWGSCLWTLPQLLLCPREQGIKLYVVGSPDAPPKALAKRNIAERAWDDVESVKELVDHFEASTILRPLEFLEAALRCFSALTTDQFSQGDITYAIMGLLPQRDRPQVIPADSGFQAFARLSTSYDSGQFLERLFCVVSPNSFAPWYDTADVWGTKLSSIIPACRILDVVDAQTVLLDGAFAAAIQWDRLDALPLDSPATSMLLRFVAWMFVVIPSMGIPILAMINLRLYATPVFIPIREKVSLDGRLLTLFLPLALSILATIIVVFGDACNYARTRVRGLTQVPGVRRPVCKVARFYGIEGQVNAATVERYLFGFWHGRLREVDHKPPPQHASGRHVFILVDTVSMTITQFRARKPPVAVFVCGREEGGMQRALLCSYDPESESFCREVVMRMPSAVLDNMARVEKFRFSHGPATNSLSPVGAAEEGREQSFESDLESSSDREAAVPRFQTDRPSHDLWKADVSLFLITLLVFIDPIEWQEPQFYFTLFLPAQLATVLLLSRLPSWLIISPVLLPKQYLYFFSADMAVPEFPGDSFGQGFLSLVSALLVMTLKGLIDGVAIPIAVALIRALYPPRLVASRLLFFWVGGIWLTESLLPSLGRWGGQFALRSFVTGLNAFSLMGLQRLIWQMRASFRTERIQRPTVRSQMSSILARVPKLLAILFVSMSAAIPEYPLFKTTWNLAAELLPVLLALLLGIGLSWKPGFKVPAILVCSLLPHAYTSTPWLSFLLLGSGKFVLPLLWAFIVTGEDTLGDFIAAIVTSMVGIGINGLEPVRSSLPSHTRPLVTAFFAGLVVSFYYTVTVIRGR